ncbi:hypothetical protein BDZ89DRAFT_596346 [Hymenopellis radicata]|nr:hypothetical protein BDZ89DRAFT_596346 [Hymenopellis radicata]
MSTVFSHWRRVSTALPTFRQISWKTRWSQISFPVGPPGIKCCRLGRHAHNVAAMGFVVVRAYSHKTRQRHPPLIFVVAGEKEEVLRRNVHSSRLGAFLFLLQIVLERSHCISALQDPVIFNMMLSRVLSYH